MKIYLHIGYHKTGSSFLQMMLSNHRKYLMENGIYYPMAERDRDAKQGKISPGNGLKLSKAILNRNTEDFSDCLLHWIKEAKTANCNRLLISNEGLFHSLALIDYVEFFEELGSKTQISSIQGLIFIRDPFDHIISLYKHRGKKGGIPNFAEWVERDYNTLDLTEKFIEKSKSDNITWTYRKYKNDSEFMAGCLFSDWLKISSPDIPKNDQVNTSLTLSEIIVLRELNKMEKQEAVLLLQSEFSRTVTSNKATDTLLSDYYRSQLNNWFITKEKTLHKINLLLSSEEKLHIPRPQNIECNTEILTLTIDQLNKVILSRKTKNNFIKKIAGQIKAQYLKE